MTDNPRTRELLHHLATRPGHDEVKSDFRQLLVEEFGVELGALDFERRVPEVKGRLDALIGRTVFEAKRNLDQEWDDVVRRMPDYLADREREEGERFARHPYLEPNFACAFLHFVLEQNENTT